MGGKLPKNVFVKHGSPVWQKHMGPSAQRLCSSREREGPTLLLTVPELHSTHGLGEVTAREGNPPLPRGPCSPAQDLHAVERQKRPPAAPGPRPRFSSTAAAHPAGESAAGDSSLCSAIPAPSSTPSCQFPLTREFYSCLENKNRRYSNCLKIGIPNPAKHLLR